MTIGLTPLYSPHRWSLRFHIKSFLARDADVGQLRRSTGAEVRMFSGQYFNVSLRLLPPPRAPQYLLFGMNRTMPVYAADEDFYPAKFQALYMILLL